MRGAWGKPYGKVARVNIGQPLISIRCKDVHKPVIMEALRRARYKFPGRQKIIVSKKVRPPAPARPLSRLVTRLADSAPPPPASSQWGFTPVNRPEYEALRAEKKVIEDGAYVQFLRPHGPLLQNLQTSLRA